MNNTRYLEVSSSNRNRNQFPYPSDFDVILGVPNSLNIVDPVISGAYYFLWKGTAPANEIFSQDITKFISIGFIYQGEIEGELVLNQTSGNPPNTMTFGNPYPKYNGEFQNSNLNSDKLYYNGFRLYIYDDTQIYISRIIESYYPEKGTIFVNPAIPEGYLNPRSFYVINDPSINSTIHIPLFDNLGRRALTYEQAYNKYYIIDESLSYNSNIIYSKIINYNSSLRLADLEISFPSEWKSDDIYSLVKYIPEKKYIIENIDPYNHQITLPSYLTYGTGYFTGKYLYNTGLFGTGGSSTGIMFQTIDSTGPPNSAYLITDYSGSPSNIVTISQNSTNLSNNNLPQINHYGIPGLNDIITICNLDQDNFYPLIYSDTLVSQNEAVAYEVSLIQLCLPNVPLDTGSFIAQYPFVYVELKPIGSPSSVGKNLIYSNNPNASRALFSVAITDVVDPLTSVFTRISTNQVQTVKIKPNDSFHFSVYLSDGKLFLPFDLIGNEFYSPLAPNPFYQIEAVFGFRRL